VTVRALGLLPARGGSKGIPRKNLKRILGETLVAWSGRALVQAPSIQRAICSTDDAEIAREAERVGLEVPFMRPPDLAGDTAMVKDVIRHVLGVLAEQGEQFEYVVLVQPTSPTVIVEDVETALGLAVEHDLDTVITGFRAGMQHPAVMYTLKPDQTVSWLMEGYHERRRQDYPEVFVRTGLVYVIRASNVLESNSIYGPRVGTHIIDESRAVTIDEELDLQLAERLLEASNS